MSPTAPLHPFTQPVAPDPSSRECPLWTALIEGDPEPALLSRLLQKLICQSAVIRTLRYEHKPDSDSIRVEVSFSAEAARAHLLTKQWQTIVTVQRVSLHPNDDAEPPA